MQLMSYSFFQNSDCEYFPCHKLVTNGTDRLDYSKFSCLFCFCPLYSNMDCGGQYHILDNGWKDCSSCILPHYNYDYIIQKLRGNQKMKRFSQNQIDNFKTILQSKLPNYILADVSDNETSGYLKTIIQFPDGSKVSYVYQLQDDSVLDEHLAIHCIRCAIDIAMTNLNNHLKLLEKVKNSVE